MKHNKFSKFIEHILVCLPLLFLGITSAYVVFNKNAKDSNSIGYNISTITYLNDIPSTSSLGVGDDFVYYFTDSNISDYGSSFSGWFFFDNISLTDLRPDTEGFRIRYSDNKIQFRTSTLSYYDMSPTDFTFTLSRFGNSNTDWLYCSNIYVVSYSLTSTLDNVLPYSMGEFNKLGFGKIPFTSFFTSIFMNGETNVYVEFVNSYLNYFLFVEATYFLPMVIYWFIHFGERLINKFSNKEF